MAHKVYTVPFRRKRQGKTAYKRRLALLKNKSLRLVVRKSNKNILAQLIKYGKNGDVVIQSAASKELDNYGWNINKSNIPSAYLTGLLIGLRAKGESAIVDLGLQIPIKESRLFAVVKGAIDAGMKISFSEEVVPPDDRIRGVHIIDYSKKIKKDTYEKIFSGYLKKKKKPELINEYFEKTKQKILDENGRKKASRAKARAS